MDGMGKMGRAAAAGALRTPSLGRAGAPLCTPRAEARRAMAIRTAARRRMMPKRKQGRGEGAKALGYEIR